MNAFTKNLIRIWIALTSLFAFAIGWFTLARAESQADQAAVDTAPAATVELAPVPSFEDLVQANGQTASSVPVITIVQPRLTTRGS